MEVCPWSSLVPVVCARAFGGRNVEQETILDAERQVAKEISSKLWYKH